MEYESKMLPKIHPEIIYHHILPLLQVIQQLECKTLSKYFSKMLPNIKTRLHQIINKRLPTDLLQHNFCARLFDVMKINRNVSIGGSTILQMLFGEVWAGSDLDIYVTYKPFDVEFGSKLKAKCDELGNIDSLKNIRSLYEMSSLHQNTEKSEILKQNDDIIKLFDELKEKNNFIMSNSGLYPTYGLHETYVQNHKCSNGFLIQLIFIPDTLNNMFQLTGGLDFCNNFYSWNKLYMYNYGSVINKVCYYRSTLYDEAMRIGIGNMQKRQVSIRNKYTSRGFKIISGDDYDILDTSDNDDSDEIGFSNRAAEILLSSDESDDNENIYREYAFYKKYNYKYY